VIGEKARPVWIGADVNVGEDMSKVKSHIGVQLQSTSFFDNLKGI
jgi:hypothetical protein